MANGSWANAPRRLYVVDALRGFAIAAILLIHSSNNFLYSTPLQWSAPEWILAGDKALRSLLYFLLEGKAYSIFALLFGFTYALQYQNQRNKGNDFRYRMIWRMVLLLGFGVLNAGFFAGGDPLVFYALVMLCIIPFIRLSSSMLFLVALLFLFQPILWIDRFVPIIGQVHGDYYQELAIQNDHAGFFTSFFNNITIGLKACLAWALEMGRMTQTAGLFLLGMLAYRYRFFERSTKEYSQLFILVLPFTVALYYLKTAYSFTPYTMYYNLFFSALLISLFILVYKATDQKKIWTYLIPYGQLSLTNFIGQSFICSFLFYEWGLNLAAYLGVMGSVLVGVFVLIFQVFFSIQWQKHFSKGPLETLWHRYTWIAHKI